MVLLSIENISKKLKDVPLFSDVTFGMEKGERIGVIGQNGTGKSTLLHIIAKEMEPDTGTVSLSKGTHVALLSQHTPFNTGSTVAQFFYELPHPSISLLKEYHELIEGEKKDRYSEDRLHHLLEIIEEIHGWDILTRYTSYLGELKGPALQSRMDSLSGGMIKKVALARVLSSTPELLLLDEPTNHLDIPTIEWLEHYLKTTATSLILVTHDRYVLDSVCTRILEIDRKGVYFHPGSYRDFLQRRENRLQSEKQEQERLQSILRGELQWLQRGPKARTGKDSGRKKRIEHMQEAIEAPIQESTSFSSIHTRMGKKILEMVDVSKKYGEKPIITSFSHSFLPKTRIGLLGPNGSGKTTFLDLIAGRIASDTGIIERGVRTTFGYYDQLDKELNLDDTVIDHIDEIAHEITVKKGQTVSSARFLELFGFSQSFHRIPIGMLSGGERRRLHLISILATNPNFLLLDEPTNDLDIDTIRRLEEYILDFSGCVVIVSHDRALLDRLTDTLFIFSSEEEIQKFSGNYSEYRNSIWLEGQKEEPSAATSQKIPAKERNYRQSRKEEKGLSFKEKRELVSIVEEIEILEKQLATLEESFSDSSSDPTTLGERTIRYHSLQKELDKKFERWEVLAEKE